MIKKNYRKTVGIFGGTGFIGEEIVQHLVKNGFKIKIATRNVYLAQNLKVYGDIAQKLNRDTTSIPMDTID